MSTIKIVPVINGIEDDTAAIEVPTEGFVSDVSFDVYKDGEYLGMTAEPAGTTIEGTTESFDPSYLIPSKVYTVLKWFAILIIPAVSWFIQTLGTIWGLDIMEPIAYTVSAVATLLGVIIGISALNNYRATKALTTTTTTTTTTASTSNK